MARHETQALWALAAGELDAADRARVEAHLAGCAECAAELARVRQSRAVLHTAREVTPEVRWGAVDARLRSEAAKRLVAPPRSRLPWALALAGACAAMLGFWMLRTPEVVPGGAGTPVARVEGAPGAAQAGDGVPGTASPELLQPGEGVPGTASAELLQAGDGVPGTASAELLQAGDGAPGPAQAELLHADDGASGAASAELLQAGAGVPGVASAQGVVVREAGGAEKPLQAGAKLRSGVAVRTPARSTALLKLPDESRVRLSAGSEVELSRAEAKDVHLTVRQGRLSVQASHAERQGFLVEAAGLRVTVVGTVFTVERTEQGAAVAVSEGRVRVEADGQPTRFVGAGERVELNAQARTLTQEPLSGPDQQALAELSAPALVQAGPTPAANAVSGEKPKPPSRRERPQVASTQSPLPEARPQVAATTPLTEEKPRPPSEDAASEKQVAAAPRVVDPNQEFAPYPAQSVTESLPPKTAPAPEPPPVAVAEAPIKAKKKKEPLIPMELLSNNADERFLGYARMQLTPRTCANFLVGLDEIAQRSPVAAHREQAKALRARCVPEPRPPQAPQRDLRQPGVPFPGNGNIRPPNNIRVP
jgi:hypothetical protein